MSKETGIARETQKARDFLNKNSIDDISETDTRIHFLAKKTLALYRTEFELWSFGYISDFHWKRWEPNFKADGETLFWQSVWMKYREHYKKWPDFHKFMDQYFISK